MKKFISIIWEEGNINENKLVQSIIGTANIPLKENKVEYIVGETEQGANLLRIGIAKNLSESQCDKLSQQLANKIFEMGLSEFDLEFTSDNEVMDEETYDGDEFFEAYGVMWFNEDEVLDEAFNQPYKTKSKKSEFGDVDVLAKLPDGTNLSIMFNHEGDDEWGVEFYRNNSQEVTGEGDAQRIFATVLNAIQKFVKKHKPQMLKFTASKEVGLGQNSQSRAKLYDRLVQRYAHAMGYEAYQEDHGVGVVYELTRLEGVTESQEQKISVKDILVYLKKVMGTESHEDWRNNVIDNNKYFVLKNIPLNSLWIDLPMLDKANVEKYKQMDFSKAPPIVIGSDGNIIDGYHRANVAKALGIKSIKAYVGVKGVTESLEETYDGDDFYEAYGDLWFNEDEQLDEAEYHGRKVPLGKPIRSSGGPKKFHVFVKNGDKVKKVNFGDPNMKIKKSNPARRRSFRARHNCDNPGPRTKARYWSCRKW
jgi:hypothetical protein